MKAGHYSIFALSAFCAAHLSAQTAPDIQFEAADIDYYWNGFQANYLHTQWSETQDSDAALVKLPTTGTENLVLGRTTATTTSKMLSLDPNEDVTFKGMYINTDSNVNTDWTIYSSGTATAASGSVASITFTDGIASDSSKLIFRARKDDGDLNVTSGLVYLANGANITLGETGDRTFLQNLTLTDGIVAKGSATAAATLTITANVFSMAANKDIYLEKGILNFANGTDNAAADPNRLWTSPTIDLSTNTMYVSGASKVLVGTSATAYTSNVTLGDVKISDAAGTTNFEVFTTGEYKMGKIETTYAASATTTNTITLKTGGRAVTVASMSVAANKIDLLDAVVTVDGNFVASAMGGANVMAVAVGTSAPLTIKGVLQVGTRIRFDESSGNAGNVSVITSGITGGSGDGTRVTTNYTAAANTRSGTTITLNGSDDYVFKGRVHDLGQTHTAAEIATMGTGAALSIIMEGSGTQRLSGSVYYRGDTVIKSGELYINADPTRSVNDGGSAQTGALWGIGAVKLQGGKFGAISNNSEIGKVRATSLEFTGGTLHVDIDGAKYDQIMLADASGVVAASGSDIKVELNFLSAFDSSAEYEIIKFDDGQVVSSIDWSDAKVTLTGLDGYTAELFMNASGNIGLRFTQIPEPAHIAGLLGLVALLLSARRGRK